MSRMQTYVMRSVVCALFLFTVSFGSVAMSAEGLKVGDKAPDFKLEGTDGKTYELKDFKGKAVVVAWFPKADTPGCTLECKSFKEDGKLLRDFDVAYFTASVDSVDDNKKFAKKLDLDYPILSDTKKETAKAYGILNKGGMANRVTFIIDTEGKIAKIIGANAKKDKNDAVKTETHAQQVADQLKELKVPAAKKKA